LQVSSILVDFDGTACAADVASALCDRFSAPGWQALDEDVRRGDRTLRAAIDGQTAMLLASPDEMLAFVLERYAVDPGFVRLVDWARAEDVAVVVVSDGFGFYIRPLLTAAGLGHLPVLANRLGGTQGALHLEHPFAHPRCVGCGTCKMRAVLQARAARGPVAFVGEGESDRFGALFADAVFAKDRLAVPCRSKGICFSPWHDFRDVRDTLMARAAAATPAPDSSAVPTSCPGWTEPHPTDDGGDG
jgi:2-hydroxy-3-keto-5-methylthiopentenyl-1-phosphate phosphatase